MESISLNMILVKAIMYLLFLYIAFSVLYFHLFSWAALLPSKKLPQAAQLNRKYAVLIPGYKEDAVIVSVAQAALRQDANPEKFDVVVIADSFKTKTLEKLRSLPIKLIEVSFELSTKSKALNKAMEQLGDEYDVALVLDADNVLQEDFLLKLEAHFDAGFQVVQGHRVAKNTQSHMAQLDAISEEINNSIFRKAHRAMGLSSALIGSGMAFEYSFFKSIMNRIEAIGGFDKELELEMLRDKIVIAYASDALVYDEKVSRGSSFENQRRRWLSAQFIYLKRYFGSALKHLVTRGNIDFFDKAIQMALIPRSLLIAVVGALGVSSFFISVTPGSRAWQLLLVLLVLSFLFSIPRSFYSIKTLKAILYLPSAIVRMFLALMKIKGANKKFIHTPHGDDSSS